MEFPIENFVLEKTPAKEKSIELYLFVLSLCLCG